jgi:gluconokinase
MGPTTLVVMGVSGSGKSTVGAAVAERLGVPVSLSTTTTGARGSTRSAAGWPHTPRAA